MADLNINPTPDYVRTLANVLGNIVFNGDFEWAPAFTAATSTGARWINGTVGGSSTDSQYGWATYSRTGSALTQFDSSVFHSGSQSLKINLNATGQTFIVGSVLNNTNDALHCFPCLPSTSYTVTWWMKTNYTSGSSKGAYMRIVDRDSTGLGLDNFDYGTPILTTTDWTLYSMTVTTRSTAAFLSVHPALEGSSGAGTLIMDAWFDDIVLTKTNPQNNIDAVLGPLVTPGIQNISGPKIWG